MLDMHEHMSFLPLPICLNNQMPSVTAGLMPSLIRTLSRLLGSDYTGDPAGAPC